MCSHYENTVLNATIIVRVRACKAWNQMYLDTLSMTRKHPPFPQKLPLYLPPHRGLWLAQLLHILLGLDHHIPQLSETNPVKKVSVHTLNLCTHHPYFQWTYVCRMMIQADMHISKFLKRGGLEHWPELLPILEKDASKSVLESPALDWHAQLCEDPYNPWVPRVPCGSILVLCPLG